MDDAEPLGIAVMGGAQHRRLLVVFARHRHVGRPLDDRHPNSRLNAIDSTNWHDDVSLKVTVECAAVARATCRQFSRPAAGMPQLTMTRCCL